jgi:hypothetical protein
MSTANKESSANTAPVADAPSVEVGDDVSQEVLASEVVTRLLGKFEALAPAELQQVNLDIPAAVATVLGALPEIAQHRAQIVASMPQYDLVLFDELEAYALALNDVHGSYLIATRPSDQLQAVVDEATKLRETLLTDTTALVHRGLVDGKRLAELKGSVGYKNLATDLNVLFKALKASWGQIGGRSTVTEAEIERAAKLQQRLIRLIGLREQSAQAATAANELRQRAFTAFMLAYDHVRRAISFLRWQHGDVDNIAPSLYAGRGGAKRKTQEPATSDAPLLTPVVPAVTPEAGASAPGANAAVASATVASATTDPFLS